MEQAGGEAGTGEGQGGTKPTWGRRKQITSGRNWGRGSRCRVEGGGCGAEWGGNGGGAGGGLDPERMAIKGEESRGIEKVTEGEETRGVQYDTTGKTLDAHVTRAIHSMVRNSVNTSRRSKA